MRTYGRVTNKDGTKSWVEVTTDNQGYNDYVWLTTLCQTLQLNLNESPFFANYGIPSQQSVLQQVFPDYYVSITQQQYSQYFANLNISKVNSPTPTYQVSVVTSQGVPALEYVPVPQ